MATRAVCIVLAIQVVSGSEHFNKNEGFMEHLNTGMKFAQNILEKLQWSYVVNGHHYPLSATSVHTPQGNWNDFQLKCSESVALKVADFVVRAFHVVSPQGGRRWPGPAPGGHGDSSASQEHSNEEKRPFTETQDATSAPLRYLFRLLGLQPNQLSVVAINALVFVAQMITSFLGGPRRPGKPFRSDDPADWILNKKSKKLQDIIATAKNDSLTDLVEELVAEFGEQEETSCIRLLVCKITPFVSRMQEAVFGNANVNNINNEIRGAAVLYRHLPSEEEIRDKSIACEKKFPHCELNE